MPIYYENINNINAIYIIRDMNIYLKNKSDVSNILLKT